MNQILWKISKRPTEEEIICNEGMQAERHDIVSSEPSVSALVKKSANYNTRQYIIAEVKLMCTYRKKSTHRKSAFTEGHTELMKSDDMPNVLPGTTSRKIIKRVPKEHLHIKLHGLLMM
ncbi:hypothetical protein F8M41_005201 [Gigaspora margarita]|uniref:Uncharacterized protein n=1 Tax=Gigaspora margarita TaxID=4874 RepID=A0A8H4ERS9_GIGMA|nr:hypothetical protein F8M41_005201 [Gigaspora margarita]